jgi:PAS domain S-box-containing protein
VEETKPMPEPAPEPEKPAVRIADRTSAGPAKPVSIAADKPDLQRTDPKILYYQLMNALYDVILVLDDEGHVIDCNIRAESVFGYSSDDVWNMPIDKIVHGMNTRMIGLLRRNLANKQHILIDARCFRSNGTSFLAEVGVSLIQLTRSECVIFAIRSVEKRKNSVEELRKLRASLDIVPHPVFTCNLHGEFEVLNPPLLAMLGMTDEVEARKKHFNELLPDMMEFFQAAVNGETVTQRRPIVRADGSSYTLELRLRPLRTGQEISGVVGAILFF